MSTFVISATTATFTADAEGFSERTDRQTGLRSWTFSAVFSAASDYTTLFGLRSWLVSRYAAPGGSGLFADVGGGSGKGTLTIDNAVGSPFSATLSEIGRPSWIGGDRKAQVTFDEVP